MMAIISQPTCSNCGQKVPEQCDGRVFKLKKYTDPPYDKMRYCKGGDGIFLGKDGKYYYHFVMGHGTDWNTEAIPIE